MGLVSWIVTTFACVVVLGVFGVAWHAESASNQLSIIQYELGRMTPVAQHIAPAYLLIHSPCTSRRRFGYSLAGDRSLQRIIVGSPDRGIFTIYRQNTSTSWEKELDTRRCGNEDCRAGTAVAMDELGNYVAIGGPLANDELGAVWTYRRTGSTWTIFGAQILGNTPSQLFGYSIAISHNGSILAVGSPGGGHVNLYRNNGTHFASLPSEELTGVLNYGSTLEMTRNGHFLFIGSPTVAEIVVYKLDVTPTTFHIELIRTIQDSDGSTGFGHAIAIQESTTPTLVIGAPLANRVNLYSLVLSSNTIADVGITLSIPDEYRSDESRFGSSVDISQDGRIVVGAPGVQRDFIYMKNNRGNYQLRYIRGPEITNSSDEYAHSVLVADSGCTDIIGSPGFNRSCGGIYVDDKHCV